MVQKVEISNDDFEARLLFIAKTTPWFMDALSVVLDLGLASWCIGAGAVRNLVWDALDQSPVPSELSDVDVAYFDNENLDSVHDAALQRRLTSLRPDIPWEVTNQAAVHLWFESYFGHPVEPLLSLPEAIASWPEYATSVGITIDADGELRVIAPHGLHDLFSMTIRRNPTRVSVETYRQRVAQKKYTERWPKVEVIDC